MQNKNYITQYLFFTFSIVWNIALFFLLFCSLSNADLHEFFHADLLSFPTFYKDIFIDGYSYKDWVIGGATYLFPDRMLYVSLLALFDNFRIAAFTYSLLQYMSVLLLFFILIRQFVKHNAFYISGICNIFFSLFIIQAFQGLDFFFSIFIFLSNYHIGSFIMSLITLIFIVQYIQKHTRILFVGLVLLQTIAVFSDMLFVVYLSIPVIGARLLLWYLHRNKNFFYISISSLIAILLGYLCTRALIWFKIIHFNQNYNLFTVSEIQFSFSVLWNQLSSAIISGTVYGTLILISFILLITAIIIFIKQSKNAIQQSESTQQLKNFLLSYYIIFFIVTLIVQPLNGNYFAKWLIRYIMPIFYLSILLLPLFSFLFLKTKIIKPLAYISVSGIIIISCVYIFRTKKIDFFPHGFQAYATYYPKHAQDVDSLVQKYNLQYGVTDFFNAKVLTHFSKHDARIYSVYDNFYPWVHGANKMWYIQNNGKYHTPIFEFAVLKKGDDLTLPSKNIGLPIGIDTIGSFLFVRYNPFIYEKYTYKPTSVVDTIGNLCF